MIYIYVLKLVGNRYYVGKATQPITCHEQYMNAQGSLWTQRYPPIGLHELIPDCEPQDIDVYTLKYIQKYGIECVRGGSFSDLVIKPDVNQRINHLVDGTNCCCGCCHQVGHMIHQCPLILTPTPSPAISHSRLYSESALKLVRSTQTHYLYERVFNFLPQRLCTINLLTSYPIMDIDITDTEYRQLISKLTGNDGSDIHKKHLLQCFYDFLQLYSNDQSYLQEHNKITTQTIYDEFIINKLSIIYPVITANSRLLMSQTHNSLKELENYVDCMRDETNSVVVVEVSFCHKSFVSKFILDVSATPTPTPTPVIIAPQSSSQNYMIIDVLDQNIPK